MLTHPTPCGRLVAGKYHFPLSPTDIPQLDGLAPPLTLSLKTDSDQTLNKTLNKILNKTLNKTPTTPSTFTDTDDDPIQITNPGHNWTLTKRLNVPVVVYPYIYK